MQGQLAVLDLSQAFAGIYGCRNRRIGLNRSVAHVNIALPAIYLIATSAFEGRTFAHMQNLGSTAIPGQRLLKMGPT